MADPTNEEEMAAPEIFADSFFELYSPAGDTSIYYPSLFANGIYPIQYEAFTPEYSGETRGIYNNNRWRPEWSRFRSDRGRPGYHHSGVDIYSPVGTPIVASANGRVQNIPEANGASIGNRVWLWVDDGGDVARIVYGHLAGFEGEDRRVQAGEVIGYSGCSGNADYDNICSELNDCGMTAAHVHLVVFNRYSQALDPVARLGWDLRYYDDDRNILCHELGRAV